MVDKKVHSKEGMRDVRRQIIKQAHPDQDGTTEDFKQANNTLDDAEKCVENGETIRIFYDSEDGASYTKNPEQHSSSTKDIEDVVEEEMGRNTENTGYEANKTGQRARTLESYVEEGIQKGVEGTDYEITGIETNTTGFRVEINEQGTTYTATVRAASNTEGDQRLYDVEAEYSSPGGGHRFKNTNITWNQATSEVNSTNEENIDEETAIRTTAKMAELSIQWAAEQ
jgi:hypothetical protein